MPSQLCEISILKLAEVHAKPNNFTMAYGTAGFRGKADTMDHIFFRMGLLAVLRSRATKSAIGVMVTASHNPEQDNGVKLIDPAGEMLVEKWESYATQLANVNNDDLVKSLENIIEIEKLNNNQNAVILLARDTRPSSISLSKAVLDGVSAMKEKCIDYGLLTTPQLHYIVSCYNDGKQDVGEDLYYSCFSNAFQSLVKKASSLSKVTIDCANGVGADKLKKLVQHIGSDLLRVNIVNDGSGRLNDGCGADYVKIQQKAPTGLSLQTFQRYASYDGDADRIVYYSVNSDGKFILLDGDKIASLFVLYIKELLDKSKLDVNLGMVQTAYANGSSTKYVQDSLNVSVACTCTGVKHLHHKALDFDIGVYFEANGHGTVTVKKSCREKIAAAVSDSQLTNQQQEAAQKLKSFLEVINETVGDAMCDMLAVEAILLEKCWTVEDWLQLYSDLPNRQLKVKVTDRTAITTTDAERKAVTPQGLQTQIDSLVSRFPCGRSFVRPSGTEDVVRVYAESDTQENADSLAHEVSVLVFELAGGVGDRPKPL